MNRFSIGFVMFIISVSAVAAQYRVNYGWTDPTTYLPSDAPSYAAQYRVSGGTPVILTGTTVPAGTFNLTAASGVPIEMCVQNKNGILITPESCTGNWIAVGNTPPPPLTQPGMPAGFSATIIYLGQ
jgi:hypothetical protein